MADKRLGVDFEGGGLVKSVGMTSHSKTMLWAKLHNESHTIELTITIVEMLLL